MWTTSHAIIGLLVCWLRNQVFVASAVTTNTKLTASNLFKGSSTFRQLARELHGDDDDSKTDDAAANDAAEEEQKRNKGEYTQFKFFKAYNESMTCSVNANDNRFNNQIRGVNLGGWMVLEPWITPSLFYQFLGKGAGEVAFDHYTFCEVLGPEEGNKQLKRHWDMWLNESIIETLAKSGAVNSLRLPVGDFMYVPYGPYKGCVDGALERVEKLLDWAHSYGMSVLLDIHTQKDSQNGFDNSGQSMGFSWTTELSSEFAGLTTFEHWPVRTARWIGEFDPKYANYSSINWDNIAHSLKVIETVVDTYADHPAVLGLEPVNEPWQFTPLDVLKKFYWEGYLIMKKRAPYWKYIMHDSFRFDPNVWGGFMAGCPERALDTHIYQAWHNPDGRISYYMDACHQKSLIAKMERAFGPVVVGEWSLATDNCAMWLNGFNDNLPGFPRLPCKYSKCADPYLGTEQPGTPVDPSKPLEGPFGTGISGPIFGLCPGDRDWIKESGNPITGRDWIAAPPQLPKRLDDTDDVMTNLALKKIDAFSGIGHGFYFWNFRTDLYEPQWSYIAALDRGWIPKGNLNDEKIRTACQREDLGQFKCVLKKGQLDRAIRGAVEYCLSVQNLTNTKEGQKILSSSGPELYQAGQQVLADFFEKNRLEGATCDFGGIAMLIEENRTLNDDEIGVTDDEYYGYIVYRGPPTWVLIVGGILVALLSSLIGFVLAMRFSPRFNQKVRSTALFRPIVQSKSSIIRSSLNLPMLGNREELEQLWQKGPKGHDSAPRF